MNIPSSDRNPDYYTRQQVVDGINALHENDVNFGSRVASALTARNSRHSLYPNDPLYALPEPPEGSRGHVYEDPESGEVFFSGFYLQHAPDAIPPVEGIGEGQCKRLLARWVLSISTPDQPIAG